MIGAPVDNDNVGAAWLFKPDAGIWTQRGSKLTADDEAGEAAFGYSTALSIDGSTALIGGDAAVGGNGEATFSFTPPEGPVTSYTVTSSPGGLTATGGSSPLMVTGLTNGTSYTFAVTATDDAGTGPPSTASNAVTPVSVPGAPTGVSATAGDGQATVSFSAPGSDGSSAITSYTVTSGPGGLSASSSSSPLTVTGLTNGTSYVHGGGHEHGRDGVCVERVERCDTAECRRWRGRWRVEHDRGVDFAGESDGAGGWDSDVHGHDHE